MISELVEAFGCRVGIPELGLEAGPGFAGGHGVAALDIQGIGRLYLEGGEGELLVYLAESIAPHEASSVARRLLELAGNRLGHSLPLHGGIHGDRAVAVTRLPLPEATAAAIENAALFLAGVLAQALAREGGR